MKTRIGIAKLSQTGSRAGPETSEGPEIMEGGLRPLIEEMGCCFEASEVAELTPEEKEQYGTWNRLGLASRHLA